jgi:DNA polymerase-1
LKLSQQKKTLYLRRGFVTSEKKGWLIELDYSQLESRILALLAPDKTLLQWYADGEDVHILTAMSLFQKPREMINDKERDMAKRARYGVAYMGSAKTIWRSLVVDYPSLTLTDVERMMRLFFKLHPDIGRWQQSIVRQARLKGYVEAPLSKRKWRFFGGQVEPTKCVVPIQMTGADLMDRAIIEVHENLWPGELILAQIHDSLVLESGPDPTHLIKIAKNAMEREVELGGVRTRFPVDVKIGKDWGNAVKIKVDEEGRVKWK